MTSDTNSFLPILISESARQDLGRSEEELRLRTDDSTTASYAPGNILFEHLYTPISVRLGVVAQEKLWLAFAIVNRIGDQQAAAAAVAAEKVGQDKMKHLILVGACYLDTILT